MRCVALALLLAAPAGAGSLRGTIFFPQEASRSNDRPLANWRVENGILPIVVLEPEKAKAPPAAEVSVTARALRLEPRVLVAGVDSTCIFKNDDRLARMLYMKGGEQVMGREATAPGATRSIKLTAAGEYEVRDVDFPHAQTTLVVVDTPYFGRSDDKGSFKIEAPEGKYTLKVYFRGAWAASQPVEVGHGGEVLVRLNLPDDGRK
jgi:hypothetical protein